MLTVKDRKIDESAALKAFKDREWVLITQVQSVLGTYLHATCPFCKVKRLTFVLYKFKDGKETDNYQKIVEGRWNFMGYSPVHDKSCPYKALETFQSADPDHTQYKMVGAIKTDNGAEWAKLEPIAKEASK